MTQIAIITETQKDELVGQTYTTDSYFNPIQDCNDDWIISIEEIEFCTNPQFFWIKSLTLSDYCPKPPSPPIPPFPPIN